MHIVSALHVTQMEVEVGVLWAQRRDRTITTHTPKSLLTSSLTPHILTSPCTSALGSMEAIPGAFLPV